MAVKLEWGATAVLKFITERYNYDTQQYERVEADKVEAWAETAEREPKKLFQLPIQQMNIGEYYVAFYADPNKIESGKAYYVAFYWDYGGIHEVERELVAVVPDVPNKGVKG